MALATALERIGQPGAAGVFLAAALAAATPAAAQVRGTVRDDVDGSPIAGALIVLSDAEGSEITRTVTDGDGAFTVSPPVAGTYYVGAHAVGYTSVVGTEVEAGVAPVVLEVRMTPAPLAVEAVTVRAERRRRRLEAIGFYRREQAGIGRFVRTEEIEERTIDRLSDALRIEPSVMVRPLSDGSGGYRVVFRGAFTHGSPREPGDRRRRDICEPTLVLDGLKLSRGTLLDNVVDPAHVLAVELYPRAQGVPVQWGGHDAACGVIVIWTKRHEP